MIRIIIVDDHPVVRRGLKQILHEEPDIKVIGEAESAQEAFKIIRTIDCDAVVLDISLPGASGVEILKQLKYEYKKLPVLILSVHPEEQYAVRVMKAGASGYLTKESAPEELVKAIRKIISGGKYISSSFAERLIMDIDASGKPRHEKLSDREFEIMRMIAQGKAIKKIAEELYLSEKTVSTYRTRLLEKMKMTTNAEIISYALKNKLIE
ncbi:MAG: response regulator transcription factor [Syntrophales bacterium]|jgi:DNA-binding NarL/FixJ family response regulator